MQNGGNLNEYHSVFDNLLMETRETVGVRKSSLFFASTSLALHKYCSGNKHSSLDLSPNYFIIDIFCRLTMYLSISTSHHPSHTNFNPSPKSNSRISKPDIDVNGHQILSPHYELQLTHPSNV